MRNTSPPKDGEELLLFEVGATGHRLNFLSPGSGFVKSGFASFSTENGQASEPNTKAKVPAPSAKTLKLGNPGWLPRSA
jgi:hypothetical protein